MYWWDEDAEPEKRSCRLAGDPDGRILGALTRSALRVKSEPRDPEIGVIVDAGGYILTCGHLVRDKRHVYVTLFGASVKSFEAEIIETDK